MHILTAGGSICLQNAPKTHLSIDSYHIYKKKSVAQVCWAENTYCMG